RRSPRPPRFSRPGPPHGQRAAANLDVDLLGQRPPATPDRDSGRGTRAAGRRLPNAPLVNTQTHPIGPDDLEEPDVNAPREIRMSRELGSQYTDVRGVDRIDEQNGVRIAHRYGADLDVAARGAQRVPVALGGRAKRQRFGREIRHAEIDADDTFAAHARID